MSAPDLYRAARGGEASVPLHGESAEATAALFYAARTGDTSRVAYLLETSAAVVDAFDGFQSTPLFYAALCGHEEVCKLLLDSGAKCDKQTYDGERCLYAALNDRVRRLLLESGFRLAAARAHDPFLELLENLHDDDPLQHTRDVAFVVGSGEAAVRLEAHRGVIAARCPQLAQRFSSQGSEVRLPDAKFGAEALQSVLRWCYTGRLAVAAEDADATAKLLSALKLKALAEALRQEAAAAPPRQQQLALEPTREVAKEELQKALSALVDASSDADAGAAGLDNPESLQLLRGGAVRLCVEGELFWAHACFLCLRSAFFAALLDKRWCSDDATDARELLEVSPAIFRLALRWAYTDVLDAATPLEQLLELLSAADLWLLEGLKQRAALLLVPHVAPETCVPLLRVAEAAAVPRLAAAAAAAVAEGLEGLADDADLAAIVAESAASIRGRQATDSIPVLDDIAYQIRRLHAGDDEDWDDDTSASWDAPGLTPEERASAVAAARHGAAAVRLRKMAIVRQLAATVQGWEVHAVRTHT